MTPTIHNAEHIASAQDVRDLPPPVFPEIAFAGRSNVGKSSLINHLVARKKLVRTSGTPGCTRGLSLFRVELAQGSLDLVDLPGYGYAQRSKSERRAWGPMIEGFLRARAGLRLTLVLVDARRGVGEEDGMLLEFLRAIERPAQVVATKLDKLPRGERASVLAQIAKDAGAPPIGFSVVEGLGREALWKRVIEHAGLRAS